MNKQKSGVELIAEERQRQIEKEGWTAEHDEQHQSDELAIAAEDKEVEEAIKTLEKLGRIKDGKVIV